MVRFEKSREPYFESEPYAASFGDSKFRYMVDAVEDLRDQLVEQYPYDFSRISEYGPIPDKTKIKAINFDIDEDLKSGAKLAFAPPITWKKKTRKGALAWAHYRPNYIEMNAWQDLEQALDTLRHEYAHMTNYYVSRSERAHGASWKQWAYELGTKSIPYAYKDIQFEWNPREAYPSISSIDKRIWYNPLMKIQSDKPHDVVYEGRAIAEQGLASKGSFPSHLIALHPNPIVASAIASNSNLSVEDKIMILTEDVIPDKTIKKSRDEYEKRIKDIVSRDSLKWFRNHLKGVGHNELSAQDLLNKHGQEMVNARLDALRRIVERYPERYQGSPISDELIETESVLGLDNSDIKTPTDDVVIDVVEQPTESAYNEGWLDEVTDEVETPANDNVETPVVDRVPSGKAGVGEEHIAILRMYAEQMPDLSAIARDAESYNADEVQSVINDLAKEMHKRNSKGKIIRRTSQRTQRNRNVAPRGK